MSARASAALILALAVAACSRKRPDATPEGVARAFLTELEGSREDPEATTRALAWVDRASRDALVARADRTSRAQGRRFAPEEMIASGRASLAFRPTAYRVIGDGARREVEVRGTDEESVVRVPVVLEDGAWRVALELSSPPEAPPL